MMSQFKEIVKKKNKFMGIPTFFIGAFLFYWVLSNYVLGSTITWGLSMVPTLQSGESRIMNKLVYNFRNPKRKEIVVIRIPGTNEFYVKRVIGIPNDKIEIKNNVIYLNNLILSEPYLAPGMKTLPGLLPKTVFVVKPDHYFVLGDNREISNDSRSFGPVDKKWIIGKISQYRYP